MYTLLVVLAVIVAVLLAFVVLIQESKGGGLASNFASSNQIMGVRKTTDVVEKATWTLAALLVIFSVSSAFFLNRGTGSESITKEMNTALPTQQAPVQAAPAAPAAAPATPAN